MPEEWAPRPLHMSLSWEAGQHPDRDDMDRAARSALKALGMEGAQAVFVAHHDTAYAHVHIIASRIDPATGRTFSDTRDMQTAQAWGIRWERENDQRSASRKELHSLVDSIEQRDTGGLLDKLTKRESTFTAKELGRILSYGIEDGAEREKYRLEILADQRVIGLRESAEAPVTRYTTRKVLAEEMSVSRAALQLEKHGGHGLSEDRLKPIAERLTLIPEQRAAFEHMTGAGGFAMLAGEAGTGKSHTLCAVREAYEAEGFRVVGTAWTHKVVGKMREDGFQNPNTLASELKRLEFGSTRWDAKTVVIVDEAAMLSTKAQAELVQRVAASGAKVILAGDDQQLGSIERGGMFTVLRQAHGAAELHEVQRTKDAEQQRAFNQMHKRDFEKALGTLDQKGAINWSATQEGAAIGLAKRYSADVAADPAKDRFIFAYTNADVAALNDYARKLARGNGRLGEDHSLTTAHGAGSFAAGDRIQFTSSAATAKERRAGLVNGSVGTVQEIKQKGDRTQVTVALDVDKGKKPQLVRFAVGADQAADEFNGFRHGYAGTIYRGQGQTLDQAYVYHSAHWRAASAYVALSRHRESVTVFAARETATNLAELAWQMARDDQKRAASGFTIDREHAARVGFDLSSVESVPLRAARQRPAQQQAGTRPGAQTASQAPSGGASAIGAAVGVVRASGALTILGSILKMLMGEPEPAPLTARERHEARVKAFVAADRQRSQQRQALAQKYGTSGDLQHDTEQAAEMEARQRRESGLQQR